MSKRILFSFLLFTVLACQPDKPDAVTPPTSESVENINEPKSEPMPIARSKAPIPIGPNHYSARSGDDLLWL